MILHQMKQRHSVTIIITPELKQQHIWLHAYPEVQHKATNKTFQIKKKKKNFLQTLELKSMLSLFEIRLHATQESLLTSSKAQALITSSYLSSLYFFPNKMLLFTVPGNTQGCWETYAILPCTMTFPWLGASSPSRARNSDDWNRRQHMHMWTGRTQAWTWMLHSPHPGVWSRILEQDKMQLWILKEKHGKEHYRSM